MSEPDRTRQREHWQAIAEQLGLAPEPEAGSESRPEQLPVKADAKKPPEPPAPLAEPAQFSAEERPPRRGRRGRPAAPDSSPRAEPKPPSIEKSAVKQIGAQPSPPAQESPAPRRGRRRPGARASVAADTHAAEPSSGAVLSHEEKTESQTTEPRKHRGRGRQKRAGGAKPTERTATEEETSPKVETPQESEDAELDDVRSLSNWNVPSWNELIASLYRPDR